MSKITTMAGVAIMLATTSLAETLTVNVTNIQSDSGTIRMALFEAGKGFPEEEHAIALRVINISERTGYAVFSDLPAGHYGIAVYHDENGNEKLDTNLLGLPTEGYGFSNNARAALGPPRFRAVSFQVNEPNSSQTITIGY